MSGSTVANSFTGPFSGVSGWLPALREQASPTGASLSAAPLTGQLDSAALDGPPTPAEALLNLLSGQAVGLEREVEPLPGGGYETTERLRGPDYSSSYESVTGPDGKPLSRDYSSHVKNQTPAVTTDAYGWVNSFLVSEIDLAVQERSDGEGPPSSEYQKREVRYFANNPDNYGVNTESSESDEMDVVFFRPDGREHGYSTALPADHRDPALGEDSPLRQEVSDTTLPDGSLQRSEVVADELTGYLASETVTVAAGGTGAVRTVERLYPAEEVTDNLDGLGILGALGHDSAQVIYDNYLGGGKVTQRNGTSTTETLDAEGKVISTNTVDTTQWTSEDGNRTLTLVDRGEGVPPEYVLTIKDGDKISTQRFVGGSEDIEITRRFTDPDGFHNITIETQTPEGADRALDEGAASAVEHATNSSKFKEEARVEDLQKLLGAADFERLATENPEFRALTESLGDSTFALLDMQSQTTLVDGEGATHDETHRAIGITTPEGVLTLTFDQESGGWTLSEPRGQNAEGPRDPVDLVRETNQAVQSSLNSSPALMGLEHLSKAGSLAGPLEALSMSTAASLAKGLGVAGNLLVAGHGAYDLLANGNPRGIFEIVSGGGSALGLLGVVSAPVATGAFVLGMGGLYAYDYIDRTDMAEVQI